MTVSQVQMNDVRSDPLPQALAAALRPVESLHEAESFTRQLAHHHYENFRVVSALLPRRLRQDFCNVYAFCRVADDLGDELHDRDLSLQSLAEFRQQTRRCFDNAARRGADVGTSLPALFAALASTVARHDIPIDPFLDLLDAFEQDQNVKRYQTFADLLDYCRRSANPVGRIVLYVCGYSDQQRQHFSDLICTALQLANFWQDVRRDLLDLDRIYIPAESMRQFGVTEEQLRAGRCNDAYRQLLRFEVQRTEAMFDQGEQLLPLLDRSVRAQIRLFGRGGRAILQAIREQDYDTLSRRPSLSTWQKGRLVLAGIAGRIVSRARSGRPRT